MTITEAREIISSYVLEKRKKLQPKEIEAFSMGEQALKTIKDNFIKRHSTYGMLKDHPQIDIKTLYEQTTMYCNIINQSEDENYKIEIYQQLNTPIKVFVYWSKELHKITSINYTIKGE